MPMGACGSHAEQMLEDELRKAVLLAERAILYALGFELRQQNLLKVALDLAGVPSGSGFGLTARIVLANPNALKQEQEYYPLPQAIVNTLNIRREGRLQPPQRVSAHCCSP